MPTQNNAFQVRISSFGSYQQYRIEDSLTGNGFTVLPKLGGCLTNLTLSNEKGIYSLLDGYNTPEELEGDERCKSFFLLPFPNRLKNGEYEFEGQGYQFPIHEQKLNTSLHGFRYPLDMEIRDVVLAHDFAIMKLGFEYNSKWEYYPFDFDFETQMKIERSGRFELRMSVKNIGQKNMPIGMGWHPYFQFGHAMDEVYLKLPVSNSLDIDEGMIPTGEKSPVQHFTTSKKIKNIPVDNCFVYEGKGKKIELEFLGENYGLRYWQEANPFQYFQLYIPPERNSIAIEPMTCAPNAFQNEQGLKVLQPEEVLEGTCSISIL